MALASVPVPRPRLPSDRRCRPHPPRRQPLDHDRVHVGPAADDRAAAQLDVAFLRLVDRGAVGGVGDVDGDAHLRVDAEGTGVGAAEADLLLHGGDGIERHVELLFRRAAGGLEAHPQAGLVVHAGRVGEAVAHLLVAELKRHRVADAQRLRRPPAASWRRCRATSP